MSWPHFLSDRTEVWKLDWLCQRYHQMPSERIRLEAHGYSDATAYDFDQAVAVLAGTIETRLRETVSVEVPDRKQPAKGYHVEQRPKYTLHELLHEPKPGDDDASIPDELMHLPTANL